MEHHILVVDDDQSILELFRWVLEDEGYVVETASKGRIAIDKAKKSRFSLALLDMFLPDIRGDEVAVKLRELDESMGLIFVTGYDESIEIVESLGFKDFLLFKKPVSLEVLIGAVNNVLPLPFESDQVAVEAS
jgi:two-component system KDP operon response regulator KdpE